MDEGDGCGGGQHIVDETSAYAAGRPEDEGASGVAARAAVDDAKVGDLAR